MEAHIGFQGLFQYWGILLRSTAEFSQRSPVPAHSEPKEIRPFALPIVPNRRLFEDSARGNGALDRQGKRVADGPVGAGGRWGRHNAFFIIRCVGRPT